MNQTIVERARCKIFDADLDNSFWGEACAMAVYLINRSVRPKEAWTGNIGDVSHLRIVGTKVMVHVPKQRRKKWNSKSTAMIFVDYDKDKEGFRCIDPVTKRLKINCDVN